ncbi:apolipoprotein C-II [Taeniopygia guttata]|uniref:apolipoprotein C-II n=1 Tax=Taeniopygia guttata TaxID=59729 RepID=UPI003BB8949E
MVRPGGGGGERSGRDHRSSMARAPRGRMGALLLLLLLLLSAAAAAPPPSGPAPPPPGPAPPPPGALGQLRGYLGQVGSAAGNLLGGLDLPSAPQRIRTAYEQGVTAAVTYSGILTDQLYHWWQGEQ